MNRTKRNRALIFVCVLAVVALSVFVLGKHKENEKASQVSERQQKTDEEAKHVQFVNQYINKNVSRTPGLPLFAVAVSDETEVMNPAMGTVLIDRFKNEHAEFVDSFFKPPMVTDGLFDDVFNGSTTLFTKLEITNSIDGLLLGKETVQYSTNNAMDGVIMANMSVRIVNIPVAGQFQSKEWTFIANGTGFHPLEARTQAEQRIIKQISGSSDMSLGLISPKK